VKTSPDSPALERRRRRYSPWRPAAVNPAAQKAIERAIIPPDAPARVLRCRAAVASTLIACLERARWRVVAGSEW
jgi:hypothetical protein